MTWRACWARLAVLAIGRKNPPTLTEQKAAAWGGGPVRYRQTQGAHRWKLRLARRDHRRRKSA